MAKHVYYILNSLHRLFRLYVLAHKTLALFLLIVAWSFFFTNLSQFQLEEDSCFEAIGTNGCSPGFELNITDSEVRCVDTTCSEQVINHNMLLCQTCIVILAIMVFSIFVEIVDVAIAIGNISDRVTALNILMGEHSSPDDIKLTYVTRFCAIVIAFMIIVAATIINEIQLLWFICCCIFAIHILSLFISMIEDQTMTVLLILGRACREWESKSE